VLILPFGVILAFFPQEILFLWKQNPMTVEHTYVVLRILVIGAMLNGLMYIPYALQLAYGWTRLGIYQNLISIAIIVPLFFYLTSMYGMIGAAFVWVILNSFYVLVGIHLIHHRYLIGEQWRWYTQDIIKPLIASIVIALIGKLFLNMDLPRFQMFIYLLILFSVSLLMSIVVSSQLRTKIFRNLKFINSNAIFTKSG
jgi:O-antigen/teichoic acid export membrane protein